MGFFIYNYMNVISLIAASITVIGFIYATYRYIKKITNNLVNRIEQIELSLKTKQKFYIPENTLVVIEENNNIIKLDKTELITVDKVEGDIVYGKIFYNTVLIKVSINYLKEEK